jgi:death on curing protein
MTFQLVPIELVIRIHDTVLNPGELPGLAGDKSLEGALARIENRLAYDLINDAYDLGAAYAVAISQGHCFNDGNKRTAFRVMQVCLDLNGIEIDIHALDIGPIIVRTAQGLLDEGELGHWLRVRA